MIAVIGLYTYTHLHTLDYSPHAEIIPFQHIRQLALMFLIYKNTNIKHSIFKKYFDNAISTIDKIIQKKTVWLKFQITKAAIVVNAKFLDDFNYIH